MENKHNEATLNRPAGDRIIEGPLVHIDILKYLEQIQSETAWQENDRNAITVYKTEGQTLTLVGLHQNAILQPGTHETAGIINIEVVEGMLKLVTAEGAVNVTNGQMVALHANIPYNATAIRDTFFLLSVVNPGTI